MQDVSVDISGYLAFSRAFGVFVRSELLPVFPCRVQEPTGEDIGRIIAYEARYGLWAGASQFGLLSVQKKPEEKRLTLVEIHTRLDRNTQRKGVGRALLRAAFLYAADKNLVSVRTITPFKEGSFGFWQKTGFLSEEESGAGFLNRGIEIDLRDPERRARVERRLNLTLSSLTVACV